MRGEGCSRQRKVLRRGKVGMRRGSSRMRRRMRKQSHRRKHRVILDSLRLAVHSLLPSLLKRSFFLSVSARLAVVRLFCVYRAGIHSLGACVCWACSQPLGAAAVSAS